MKLFIDTNILLGVYQLSGPDLDELRKLVKLVESGKIELLLNQQVIDEFWRNRESVIANALKRFRESKATAILPNIIHSYPDATDLKAAVERVTTIVHDLSNQATDDIENNALKADLIIKDLFATTDVAEASKRIIYRAEKRTNIGNPPGKKGSIGDAINWEWLLEQEISANTAEVVILSGDGDFESELVKGNLKEFLLREWARQHPNCTPRLEKSLVDLLSRDFADIKLADEVDKVIAIEKLEETSSFAATHVAIAQLSKLDDFSNAELLRLLNAYLTNNQVYWIRRDNDIASFGNKIVNLAKSDEAKVLAEKLRQILSEEASEQRHKPDRVLVAGVGIKQHPPLPAWRILNVWRWRQRSAFDTRQDYSPPIRTACS